MIIAIDGPAAAGKGTLARQLAGALGYIYLDTGAIYRAVAKSVLDAGDDPDDVRTAAAHAESLNPSALEDPDLRGEEVGDAASRVAALPAVRDALLAFQRRVATTPPGAVLDGRDTGTVICPDAGLKLFVTASLEERARRRLEELRCKGETLILPQVLAELAARDSRDRDRQIAPLRQAEDAVEIDTTGMTPDAVFRRVLCLARERLMLLEGVPGRTMR
ncbi:MAG: (d)CMP kinase [Alphaproteobacteria bacterium]|nr:(d)CMP kinase [Alphaproteobacteria bacterium]MCY4231801.1 (d)CMP kinase [Alphaproteobacteria bacterium]MCY4319930.1 (d)CMP kinase [Alphaproteobacteria bacterium]